MIPSRRTNRMFSNGYAVSSFRIASTSAEVPDRLRRRNPQREPTMVPLENPSFTNCGVLNVLAFCAILKSKEAIS